MKGTLKDVYLPLEDASEYFHDRVDKNIVLVKLQTYLDQDIESLVLVEQKFGDSPVFQSI
jgi:hypothetical protein